MSFKIGDAIYTRDGLPTIVTDRDPKTAKLTVNREPKVAQESMRHGYINGLDPSVRERLNEILDDAKELQDPVERTGELQAKLTEIEKDPRNHVLARYLRSEMLHIMNLHGVKPREYTLDESKIR